jgi:hypothetical protein
MLDVATSINIMNGAAESVVPTRRDINGGFHLFNGAEAKAAVLALATAPGRPSLQYAVVASTASRARQAPGRSAHPLPPPASVLC